jgi:hypothetical protein
MLLMTIYDPSPQITHHLLQNSMKIYSMNNLSNEQVDSI